MQTPVYKDSLWWSERCWPQINYSFRVLSLEWCSVWQHSAGHREHSPHSLCSCLFESGSVILDQRAQRACGWCKCCVQCLPPPWSPTCCLGGDGGRGGTHIPARDSQSSSALRQGQLWWDVALVRNLRDFPFEGHVASSECGWVNIYLLNDFVSMRVQADCLLGELKPQITVKVQTVIWLCRPSPAGHAGLKTLRACSLCTSAGHGLAAGLQSDHAGAERPAQGLHGTGQQTSGGQPPAGGADSWLERQERFPESGLVPAGGDRQRTPSSGEKIVWNDKTGKITRENWYKRLSRKLNDQFNHLKYILSLTSCQIKGSSDIFTLIKFLLKPELWVYGIWGYKCC